MKRGRESVCAGGARAGGLLAPHDPTGLGRGDFVLPREGNSPSERRLGGVDCFLGRLGEDELEAGVSLWASASN